MPDSFASTRSGSCYVKHLSHNVELQFCLVASCLLLEISVVAIDKPGLIQRKKDVVYLTDFQWNVMFTLKGLMISAPFSPPLL